MAVVFLLLPVKQYLGTQNFRKLIFTMLSESAVLVSLVCLILLCQWMVKALYILSPLKDHEEFPHVFCPAFSVHCADSVFIARQCVALPGMR